MKKNNIRGIEGCTKERNGWVGKGEAEKKDNASSHEGEMKKRKKSEIFTDSRRI